MSPVGAVIAAAALFVATGIPLTKRFAACGLLARIAMSYLLGVITISLEMTALSLLRIQWHVLWLLLAPAVTFAVSAGWRTAPGVRDVDRLSDGRTYGRARGLLVSAIILSVAFFHGAYATLTPPWQWDWAAVWGLKAKIFHLHAGIDFAFLADPANRFSHPDYPPLVPAMIDVPALISGRWDDSAAGLLFTFLALAAAFATFGLLRGTMNEAAAGVTAVAIALAAFNPWIGLADGPLIAFISVASVLLWRAERAAHRGSLWLGFLLLGGAALTKNEGVAFALVASVALAFALRSWRPIVLASIPLLLVTPWMMARIAYRLPTDHASSDIAHRVALNVSHAGDIGRALVEHHPDKIVFWVLLLAAVALGGRRIAEERFLIAAVMLQLLVYAGAYVTSPHADLDAHVANSWPRLAWHLAPLLVLLAASSATAADRKSSGGEAAEV